MELALDDIDLMASRDNPRESSVFWLDKYAPRTLRIRLFHGQLEGFLLGEGRPALP